MTIPVAENEVKNAIREADVQICAIGLFERFGARGRTSEEVNGLACFRKSPSRLVAGVAAKIGIELRNEYQPKNAAATENSGGR